MKKFKYSEITPEKIYNKRRNLLKLLDLVLVHYALSATVQGLNKSYANTDLIKINVL
jgi:sulfoxide reductase catalytic subunit YedY